MVNLGVTKKRKTKPAVKTAKPQGPQVHALFGLPMSGTTSLIRCLTDVCETPCAVVLGVDESEIREHLRAGRTVLIDDFEPTVENLQLLHDARLVCPGNGSIIRVWSPEEDILERAKTASREDVTPDYLTTLRRELAPFEEHARRLSTPYYWIPVGQDFAAAVGQLALRTDILA